MKMILLILINSILVINYCHSQNFIPNPSFENFSNCLCPNWLTDIDGKWIKLLGEEWTENETKTYKHSLNFYHTCQEKRETNFIIKAHSGEAFIMYFISHKGEKTLNTNLFLVELTDTLIKNQLYNIEYFFKIDSYDNYILNSCKEDIEIYLTKLDLNDLCNRTKFIENKIKYTPQISFYKDSIISKYNNWMQFTTIYKATGGEKFFIIGCHKPNYRIFRICIDDIKICKTKK